MTILHPEFLLVVGMLGLYLYDSLVLLASNEALLTPAGGGRWSALFGAHGFQVRGREPCLPNPLLPHRPLYRFSWNAAGVADPGPPWTPPAGGGTAALAPAIWIMLLALFVVVPLGFFSSLGVRALVAGIVLFYVCALAALTMVWRRRDEFALGGRRFLALAFESLTCPPFALNLVRHLSLGLRPGVDFLAAIDGRLDDAARAAALVQVIARLESEIDWEGEETVRAAALKAHLQVLTRECKACRAPNS
mgnify:FL=1